MSVAVQAGFASVAWVQGERAARFVLDERVNRALVPFMEGPRSVSQAARELGWPLYAVSRRVRELRALGLVQAAGSERRRGREVTFWQAAPALFVPGPLVLMETLLEQSEAAWQERWLASLADTWTRRTEQADDPWGIRVTPAQGGLRLVPMTASGRGWAERGDHEEPLALTWQTLALRFEDARALERDLGELLGRYLARVMPGERRYILRFGLAPESARPGHPGD